MINMPKMTKAQAKKRLKECQRKIYAVHYGSIGFDVDPMTMSDYVALDKILKRCIKRLK